MPGIQIHDLPVVMTESQVAALLQISRSSVGRLGRSGALPRLAIGRSVRYRAADVTDFLGR